MLFASIAGECPGSRVVKQNGLKQKGRLLSRERNPTLGRRLVLQNKRALVCLSAGTSTSQTLEQQLRETKKNVECPEDWPNVQKPSLRLFSVAYDSNWLKEEEDAEHTDADNGLLTGTPFQGLLGTLGLVIPRAGFLFWGRESRLGLFFNFFYPSSPLSFSPRGTWALLKYVVLVLDATKNHT